MFIMVIEIFGNLVLVSLRTSDTAWKETGETSNTAKLFPSGRSLLTTLSGLPFSSVSSNSSKPPSSSVHLVSVR